MHEEKITEKMARKRGLRRNEFDLTPPSWTFRHQDWREINLCSLICFVTVTQTDILYTGVGGKSRGKLSAHWKGIQTMTPGTSH